MKNFNFYVPTMVFFGKGELERLASEKLPGKKAMIVTTAGGSMKKFGYLDRVIKLLEKNHTEYVLYNKILQNPIKRHVMEGAAIVKQNSCDFVIGLGGGSAIDAAKMIAFMTTNEGDLWDYVRTGSGKKQPMKQPPLPIIAITTTAGTGTEVDPFGVITNEELHEKIGSFFFGAGCLGTFPYFAIVDPDLMMTVPARLAAYQGFDTLFHATEGYIAKDANSMSDVLATKAIELIGKYLPQAVKNGDDEEARAQVAFANTLAGMVECCSNGTSEHSLEHAMSALHPELEHGAGLILISVEYYKFFAPHVPDKFIEMAKMLGKTGATDPMDFVAALEELISECGVHDLKMSDYGFNPGEMEKIALHALKTMTHMFKQDRYELSLPEIVSILESSYK